MLIFSDRFYETVASMGFVKHLLVTYILYKVLIDKLVVFEYRNGLKIKLKKMCLRKRYSINTNKANV